MNDALFVHVVVGLVMAGALFLVLRRDPTVVYAKCLAWVLLVQSSLALTFWAHFVFGNSAELGVNIAGSLLYAAYATFLLLGLARLTQKSVPPQAPWVIALVLAIANWLVLKLGGVLWALAGMVLINTLLGLLFTIWLSKPKQRRHVVEQGVGPLLVLLGLVPLLSLQQPENPNESTAVAGALLQLLLGLTLFYVVLDLGIQGSRKLQLRFEQMTERSRQAIMISFGDSRIVYANAACLALYGVDNLAALRLALLSRAIPKAERMKVGRILKDIALGQEGDASFEAMRQRADGSSMWLHFHYFRTEWDGTSAVQVLISDETDRHRANEALVYQATHDELTGLPNRAALLQSLSRRCGAQGSMLRFVLIVMNIDRFKLFNEAHGPSMGDDVLKAVGQALRASLSDDCEVMRLAGDEFALLSAPGGAGDTAVEMVSNVRDLLMKPMLVTGHEFFLDASLGIALFPSSARDAESLLRAANAAMHVAKRTPGTSHRLAEKAFERGSSNTLEQEQALRLGVERGEFELVYQPKVNAQTGILTSLEALARWNRPGAGQVSPVDFIGAAERTGLIRVLGTELLKQACRQMASWLATHGQCLPVAVNVSPLQLLDPRFPNLVSKILQDCDLEPQWLTLEITESSAVQNLEQTMAQVDQLRTLGVHVAMDDFGTGFSSLNMLRQLRLHTVKIDRGLIDPLPSPDAIAVVRAICQLAEALHLHVVAEGVETESQARAAREAGCGELQGYLYSRPLSAQDVGAWLVRLSTGYANVDIEVPTLSVKLGE